MLRSRTRQPVRPAAVVLVCGIGLALGAGLWHYQSRLMLEFWTDQLEAVPDDDLENCLAEISRQEELGVRVLVQGLGSSRPKVAAASAQTLLEQMARWELLSAAAAREQIERLSSCLAAASADFDADGRRAAALVAARLLAWPRKDDFLASPHVTADCERVVRSTMSLADAAPLQSPRLAPSSHLAAAGSQRSPTQSPRLTSPEANSLVTHLAPLPGGALPIDMHESPSAAHSDAPQQWPAEAGMTADPPRLLAVDMTQAKPLSVAVDAQAPNTAQKLDAAPEARSAPIARALLSEVDPNIAEAPVKAQASQLEARLETMLLIQRLALADDQSVDRALAELRRRGLTALEIELGKRLNDPDPAVRQRWTEALPGMADIDARPWLLWTSRDASRDVRLAALTLMATSNEPVMLRRVREMAREDLDAEVQAQAARISGRATR